MSRQSVLCGSQNIVINGKVSHEFDRFVSAFGMSYSYAVMVLLLVLLSIIYLVLVLFAVISIEKGWILYRFL